ncbi:MAG TPA: type III pantothenate kinase [Gammaproteobacteria bacterium]|nr:type III pantothenate kinase [Gammaproteobacteria bacterium]
MKLFIDIGNARIKWALQDDENWTSGVPLVRGRKAFKDIARPAWKELETPERVVVSNVAGVDYEKSVRTWVKRRWKLDVEFLRPEPQCCGVRNAYEEPDRLGADRWASLLAAHALCRGPAVIVDCGTAITVDAIAGNGEHLGGLITPGMELMRSSLSSAAPGVEADEDGQQVSLLARSTGAAVSGGILYMTVSLIDRVFMDLQADLGRQTRLLLSGGDAGRVQPLLAAEPRLEPDLVLRGLAVYAEETAECVS